MVSLDNEAAATSTPKKPALTTKQSVQEDARLMFEERDTSMTDDWATLSEREFARGQNTVIGYHFFNLHA